MNRSITIILFVVSQLALIGAYIRLESKRIDLHYSYQNQNKLIQELDQKQRELEYEIKKLQDLETIDKYARDNLNLKPVALNQVKVFNGFKCR